MCHYWLSLRQKRQLRVGRSEINQKQSKWLRLGFSKAQQANLTHILHAIHCDPEDSSLPQLNLCGTAWHGHFLFLCYR